MKTRTPLAALLFLALLTFRPAAQAQGVGDLVRTNPKFLHSFRAAVAGPSAGTVRVRCDGRDTALGMVVAADGWVLTKANDLRGRIRCRTRDGAEYDARLVGVHRPHDLALLKVDARGLTPVRLKSSKEADVGSWVAAAGTGTDPVAVGVVSVATRHVTVTGPDPDEMAKAGYLGVGLEMSDDGLRVTQVVPNSAAERADLQPGDVILRVMTVPVSDPDQFTRQMIKRRPGERVTLSVRRGDEEFDVTPTLQQRPAGSGRSELQNHMGSELSSRRSGYPTILQHDSVVRPRDCGGPLVDLDGNVIGLNVCRAGRVESWAVPAEVILTVLPELKSGRLAPGSTASEGLQGRPRPEELPARPRAEAGPRQADVDALLKAMHKRLKLMPTVARGKWNTKQAIHDPARERELLDRLVARAEEQGVDAADARRLFTAQMAAARLVQEKLFVEWRRLEVERFRNVPDLHKTLRPQVEQASNELLAAYAKVRPLLDRPEGLKLLRDRARNVLTGLDAAVRDRALQGVLPRE